MTSVDNEFGMIGAAFPLVLYKSIEDARPILLAMAQSKRVVGSCASAPLWPKRRDHDAGAIRAGDEPAEPAEPAASGTGRNRSS
ncbi:hypothetical protein EVAR_78306_1 [Eumeta japonica]|uniref:Uncharacterized protein n=1 Tax=Eumeta variegata TaxID=151549 RepID=A0A4C1T5S7_EUMVA|nr:hypothetical protein EVAR_78306_1 [Eumeta japonica]